MKRILIALLLIATAASAQIGSGFKGRGGNASVSSMLPIVADSTLWHLQGTDTLVTDGALPIKVPGIRVTGNARLDGNLTLITTAAESLVISAGGIRNEGGLRQKGASIFGATGTTTVIEADGDIGLGTDTPLHDISIVNSGGFANGSGLNIVNSAINKLRNTVEQASDSARIGLQISTAGDPYFRMRSKDADSLAIYLDGSNAILKFVGVSGRIIFDPTFEIYFRFAGSNHYLLNSTMFSPIYGATFNTKDLGGSSVISKWQDLWMHRAAYIGGKSTSPSLILGTQSTMTEQTDSTMVFTMSGGNPVISGMAGSAGTNTRRQFYFGADTLALFNGARTGRDSSWAALVNGNVLNNGIVTIKRAVSLTDAGEYTPQIPSGMCGWGSVQIGDDVEWARFRFKTDGTVTLEANSTNVGTTNDTDTKLNIYDAGTAGIVIENQLGSTLTAAFVIECHLP